MHGHAWSIHGHAWDVTFYMHGTAWDRMGPRYNWTKTKIYLKSINIQVIRKSKKQSFYNFVITIQTAHDPQQN